jgi:hypothetical protein
LSDERRRGRRDLDLLAGASLIGAAAVALARAVSPFEHGIWLVAYLFLVGFLAQLLLGRGQTALLPASAQPGRRQRLAQTVLWNLGVVCVPLGVFADLRLAVVLGAVALLAALALFRRAVSQPSSAASASARRGYDALIVFMAVSALVGTALAWDLPWL